MQFVELFKSIQGEGVFAGNPSIFARVSGCNLRCCFGDGSICDTAYTSFNPELPTFTEQDLYAMIEDNPQIDHVVFTGGEPLLYKKDLEGVVDHIINEYGSLITIETNGTLPPLDTPVHLYSVSPKLSTSVPKTEIEIDTGFGTYKYTKSTIEEFNKKRINIECLRQLFDRSMCVQYKFVYSNKESLREIEEIEQELRCFEDWDERARIMLMPEGQTEEQIARKREEVAQICVDKGWVYTDRLQILIWGQKRNV